jgi:hypothetical protein
MFKETKIESNGYLGMHFLWPHVKAFWTVKRPLLVSQRKGFIWKWPQWHAFSFVEGLNWTHKSGAMTKVHGFEQWISLLGCCWELQPTTALEPCEWLNKLLRIVWPNFIEPKLVRKLLSSLQVHLWCSLKTPSFVGKLLWPWPLDHSRKFFQDCDFVGFSWKVSSSCCHCQPVIACILYCNPWLYSICNL